MEIGDMDMRQHLDNDIGSLYSVMICGEQCEFTGSLGVVCTVWKVSMSVFKSLNASWNLT
jgi:hypothetical protein